MQWNDLIAWIEEEKLGAVRANEPMADHTSWRIGGPAKVMVWPEDTAACSQLLGHCKTTGIPVAVLGYGTNLLVADEGIDALVINTREMNWILWQDHQVRAGAGASLAVLAGQAARRGLQGLAFSIGIPGSVGGAVLMNAGAYNGMISDVVSQVVVLDLKWRTTGIIQRRYSLWIPSQRFEEKPLVCGRGAPYAAARRPGSP